MGSDDVTRSVIIDANQIILASLRVRDQVAIEKNHRDPGSIERLCDAAIDRVLLRRQFQRREKHPGHLLRH